MKIRNGFVSNSSSSSFFMLGVALEIDYDKFIEKYGYKMKQSFLEIQEGIDFTRCVVGLSPRRFDTTKNIQQIKEEIRQELIRLKLPANIDWISDFGMC